MVGVWARFVFGLDSLPSVWLFTNFPRAQVLCWTCDNSSCLRTLNYLFGGLSSLLWHPRKFWEWSLFHTSAPVTIHSFCDKLQRHVSRKRGPQVVVEHLFLYGLSYCSFPQRIEKLSELLVLCCWKGPAAPLCSTPLRYFLYEWMLCKSALLGAEKSAIDQELILRSRWPYILCKPWCRPSIVFLSCTDVEAKSAHVYSATVLLWCVKGCV